MEKLKFWFIYEEDLLDIESVLSYKENGIFETNSDMLAEVLVGHITLTETPEYKVTHRNLKFMERLDKRNKVFVKFESNGIYEICDFKKDDTEKLGKRSVLLYTLKKTTN